MNEYYNRGFDTTCIVGDSQKMKRVLDQAQTVAGTDSTVLILGETGTGKELVAKAIHEMSLRKNRAFVRADCACIPAGLLESELFGHERGAFTGAVTRNTGRFEAADKGTLFLDEVGDIPIELQSKLLRVLQEQEFERLGSSRTVHTDFRLIAATNAQLAGMVQLGRFRTDLYYRLNVFPIEIPALRQRAEDVPTLVWHFLRKYAERMHKDIETIPEGDMEKMVRHDWPGNVRELQNFIERSVVLSSGPILRAPLEELRCPWRAAGPKAQTLAEAEREHILHILRETEWVVGGPDGAATQLGLKRTTLIDKMRRLGISRPQA